MDLQGSLKEWQKALRLLDWDIEAKVTQAFEYRCTAVTGDSSQAENDIDSWHKRSMINISDNAYDQEESLVHELSHLLIDGLDRTVDCLFDALADGVQKEALKSNYERELEIAVCNITRAFIKTRDMAHEVRI